MFSDLGCKLSGTYEFVIVPCSSKNRFEVNYSVYSNLLSKFEIESNLGGRTFIRDEAIRYLMSSPHSGALLTDLGP